MLTTKEKLSRMSRFVQDALELFDMLEKDFPNVGSWQEQKEKIQFEFEEITKWYRKELDSAS